MAGTIIDIESACKIYDMSSDRGCPEIYFPHCSDNTNEWDNICDACIRGDWKEWTSLIQGPCPKDRASACKDFHPGANCPDVIRPVCTDNTNEWGSICSACSNGKKWTSVVDRPCPKDTVACTEEIAPVCASDGNFYDNSCIAERKGFVDLKVLDCGPQLCRGDVPVCTLNGTKYKNACLASLDGVSEGEMGECGFKKNPPDSSAVASIMSKVTVAISLVVIMVVA